MATAIYTYDYQVIPPPPEENHVDATGSSGHFPRKSVKKFHA